LADKYNGFLETVPVNSLEELKEGETLIHKEGKLFKTVRMPNGLYRFRDDSNSERVILDCITSLQSGADLLWIETAVPNLKQISSLVNAIRTQVPNAKLVYNNSPSFNWTLNFRQQAYDALAAAGKDVSMYARDKLMSADYDDTELSTLADDKIRSFQYEASQVAGVFHHLITLPTYHTAALSTDNITKGYFGPEAMLAYVKGVQRREIREGLDCVKHQDMAGSNIGDDHKEYFSGDGALKAGGKDNTMNQFDDVASVKKAKMANGLTNGAHTVMQGSR